MKNLKLMTGLLALLILSVSAHATPPYAMMGTIHDIRPQAEEIVIDDLTHPIVKFVVVHDGSTRMGVQHLTAEMKLGFNKTMVNNHPFITEVWVLDEFPDPKTLDRTRPR